MAVILVLSLIPGSETTGDLLALIPSTIQNLLHVPALETYRMSWRWKLTSALAPGPPTVL